MLFAQTADRQRLVQNLAAVARRDQAALEELYRRTSAKLFGVCLRILPERSEAEDVLQEVYLTVWNKADGFDPSRASPITWLVSIARNRAIDRLRAGARFKDSRPIEEADGVADASPSAAAQLEMTQEHARLRACLDGLEPERREVVTEAFLTGRTYDDLAKTRGVPLGTMKSWIRRSLIRLRECLES